MMRRFIDGMKGRKVIGGDNEEETRSVPSVLGDGGFVDKDHDDVIANNDSGMLSMGESGEEFLAGSIKDAENIYSTDSEEDRSSYQKRRYSSLIPQGDIFKSKTPPDNFYNANSHLVTSSSFNQHAGYLSVSEEDVSDEADDEDLSYDDEKGPDLNENTSLDFSGGMLDHLQRKDAPFSSNKKIVRYNDHDHFGILTEMYGSVWLRVLPFCVFNFCWCFAIDYMREEDIIDITIPGAGHSFMSILVAFLTVARVQITFARFMEARGYLGGCFKNCRELMHAVSVLTMASKNEEAKQWRQDVAIQIVATLQVTIAAVEFSTRGVDPYEVVSRDCVPDDIRKVEDFLSRRSVERTHLDKALRAPLVFASSLRKLLLAPKTDPDCLNEKLVIPEELKLLGYVTGFCDSVHGLIKLINTPFSFPLVQMSTTILFFWIFTLPMALMTDTAERTQIAIIVFFVTYGFVGLEYVSIEIDDPFGTDPNDFDTRGMARGVYEDVYLTLLQMDGKEYAEQFRERISTKKAPSKRGFGMSITE
jgi:putative membrane protein